ncbi:hypothetical protein [Xanthobacter flavus]|uniref:hypothetical protein n=1 Tax=Xanthobacter flavus TaxID=281 RepID=UPI003728D080
MHPNNDRRPTSTLDHLVAAMSDLYAAHGAATEDDLVRLGWRPEDIKRHLPAARLRLGPITSRAA